MVVTTDVKVDTCLFSTITADPEILIIIILQCNTPVSGLPTVYTATIQEKNQSNKWMVLLRQAFL